MKFSFRNKFILFCTLPILILSVITLGITQLGVVKHQDVLRSSFFQYANSLSESIGAQFFERYGDVQAFALHSHVRNLSKESLPSILDEYVALYMIYDLIMVFDLKGELVGANTKSTTGSPVDADKLKKFNASQEIWFQNVVGGKFTADSERGFAGSVVTDPQFFSWAQAALGREEFGNIFSAPIKNQNGEVIGVIANFANFKWVEFDFKIMYENLKSLGYPSAELTLLDRQGNVIIDFDPTFYGGRIETNRDSQILGKFNLVEKNIESAKRAVAGEKGSMYSMHARKKIEQVAAYSPVDSVKTPKSLGWSILVRADPSEVKSSADQIRNIMIPIIGLLFLILCGFSVWSSKHLTDALEKSSLKINEVASHLKKFATNLENQSGQISASSQNSAAGIEEISASIEEIHSTISSSKNIAFQSKEMAETSYQDVESGLEKMKSLNNAMNGIVQSSQKIVEISSVIDEIAFQTNLLSLNAAVEAARAGEQGRGFAVVADAVRQLAHRSATAAKDISHIVSDSTEKVRFGATVAEETSHSFQSMGKNFEKIKLINQEIATITAQQSAGMNQVTESIQTLDLTIQSNAKTSEDSAQGAKSISLISDEMGQLSHELEKTLKGAA
ncbi:MAG: methyl-accepting chemotaxis protein [Pseudobdellovibrionaceae bacterium]|jgi:methyl-accepting chemotaxis protein